MNHLQHLHPTLYAACAEIERELAARKNVYPRLIAERKLDRDQANAQFLRLEAALFFLGQASAMTVKIRSVSITLAEAVAEIERELKMRARFYPGFVKNRLISVEDARKRNVLLYDALDDLRPRLPKPAAELAAQTELFA
jgi:hypothetical protein